MFGSLGNGFSFLGSDCGPADYVDIEIRFAGCTNRADTTSEGLMAASKLEFPERWQKAVVYRRDNGCAVQSQLGDVPFTVWDTEHRRQLKVAFVEDANSGNANLIWDMGWNDSSFSDFGGHEYVFFSNLTYDEYYTDFLNGTLDGMYNNVMYASGWGAKGTHPYLKDAFEIHIYAANPNSENDIFVFTAPDAPTPQKIYLKEDVKNINVAPNPYYGAHSGDYNSAGSWVQFTCLPTECTIRIFDLAGNQVRKLVKNDPGTSLLRWDLRNQSGYTLASGIYIFYVEIPGIGTKIGKLAVFMPN
jgi:hypothetical protein